MAAMFEEIRIMWVLGVLSMWISLYLCKKMGMESAFSGCASQLAIMFSALVVKAGWGRTNGNGNG